MKACKDCEYRYHYPLREPSQYADECKHESSKVFINYDYVNGGEITRHYSCSYMRESFCGFDAIFFKEKTK